MARPGRRTATPSEPESQTTSILSASIDTLNPTHQSQHKDRRTANPPVQATYSLRQLARGMHAKQLENERNHPAPPRRPTPPTKQDHMPPKSGHQESFQTTLQLITAVLLTLSISISIHILPRPILRLLTLLLKYISLALLGHIFFSILHWKIYAGAKTDSHLWEPGLGVVREAQILKVWGCEVVVRRAVEREGGLEEGVVRGVRGLGCWCVGFVRSMGMVVFGKGKGGVADEEEEEDDSSRVADGSGVWKSFAS
ncbi:hypothetical protein BDV96DRAFT_603055 [Lophiotrema nucula]|uniref:Uncharacterized protein n=1 Tax=Lophiotrema nucula TaxID=690887 RepID=A0A6A5YWJ8_9PLEO|nr:hypothetical protein BDV96DRAFT_603055 [Lophiotrema nucula]